MDGPMQLYGSNTAFLSRFSKEALAEIMHRDNENGGKKEWLANVYDIDGKYTLGQPETGTYDNILVSPSGIMTRDINVCKMSPGSNGECDEMPKKLVSTIHMHPIAVNDVGGRNIRQMFSGDDIASEFVASRDEDVEKILFLTYPDRKFTQRSNRLKVIVFPNKDVSVKAMQMSNPQLDPFKVEVGDQQGQPTTPGGIGRKQVDWMKYQTALKELGYIEDIDIEKTLGAPPSANFQLYGIIILAAVAVGGVLAYRHFKKKDEEKMVS